MVAKHLVKRLSILKIEEIAKYANTASLQEFRSILIGRAMQEYANSNDAFIRAYLDMIDLQ